MTKEEILKQVAAKSDFITYADMPVAQEEIQEAMDTYAKQEAVAFAEFRSNYMHIERLNMNHSNMEKFGNIHAISWVGANDDKIWEAYKKGEQLKRYFEK